MQSVCLSIPVRIYLMVSTVKLVMQMSFKYSASLSKQRNESGGGLEENTKEFADEEERRRGRGACGGQVRQEMTARWRCCL